MAFQGSRGCRGWECQGFPDLEVDFLAETVATAAAAQIMTGEVPILGVLDQLTTAPMTIVMILFKIGLLRSIPMMRRRL